MAPAIAGAAAAPASWTSRKTTGEGRGEAARASLNHFPKVRRANTVASGEGDTCKTTALESFDQLGSSRCGSTASPFFNALRLHG
jgi:hypothetical protein